MRFPWFLWLHDSNNFCCKSKKQWIWKQGYEILKTMCTQYTVFFLCSFYTIWIVGFVSNSVSNPHLLTTSITKADMPSEGPYHHCTPVTVGVNETDQVWKIIHTYFPHRFIFTSWCKLRKSEQLCGARRPWVCWQAAAGLDSVLVINTGVRGVTVKCAVCMCLCSQRRKG